MLRGGEWYWPRRTCGDALRVADGDRLLSAPHRNGKFTARSVWEVLARGQNSEDDYKLGFGVFVDIGGRGAVFEF